MVSLLKQVQTPGLRKIAEKHLSEGHHDSVELAVYRLVQALVAILKLGGFLHDGDNVDGVISASVIDKTTFAADGKTHHRQGHRHRAGVSTGDTKAHQDQSARGITVALSMVLPGEDPTGVAHVLEQLHHTYVLYPEGAFGRQTYGNGSGVQQRARHGSVIRRVQYGNTRCEEVRVMTISPVENAHYMHRIANPDGAARVLIQFVIDPGFSLEWAERATAWLRPFFGQRLSPTSVEETEMSDAARKVLSADPNKWKSAEQPVPDAAAAEAKAANGRKARVAKGAAIRRVAEGAAIRASLEAIAVKEAKARARAKAARESKAAAAAAKAVAKPNLKVEAICKKVEAICKAFQSGENLSVNALAGRLKGNDAFVHKADVVVHPDMIRSVIRARMDDIFEQATTGNPEIGTTHTYRLKK